ncbi:hypothetical protein C5167_021688 [Papaver somniferum]|uniref:Uncharacterized protein n=1 Tax=Papaver somniferum TaxID=3469 RepID=A0A4Y7JIQ4_PAPSO|nr:hypothetical protein C5167_021688 [Papaver somniferum]
MACDVDNPIINKTLNMMISPLNITSIHAIVHVGKFVLGKCLVSHSAQGFLVVNIVNSRKLNS